MAEAIPGRTSGVFSSLAKELGVVIIAAYFEKRSSAIYHNSAVVLDSDGKHLVTYRKTHIPQVPDFEEKFYFTPRDQDFPVPNPIFYDGPMASASYVNYLIFNGAVIVPSFGQAKDKEALSVIESCFPDREVIGFNSLEII